MRIYLDHNAGTPMRPAVREALVELLDREAHGNPASVHQAGQTARRELEMARVRVAELIDAPARSILFTSGGTEANNLAIFGAMAATTGRRRIITTAIEHSSVLAPIGELERRGYEVIRAQPDADGIIDTDGLARHVNGETALISLGLANAEVGTIQDISPLIEAARRTGALLHLDAAQAAGRMPLTVDDWRCDLLTLSAHKIGGPAGCGALYVRPGVSISPRILGGPQEAGLRAGTPNLIGAIGMGVAAAETLAVVDEEAPRVGAFADRLWDDLRRSIPGLSLNGSRVERIRNTLNLTFPRVLGETMLIALDLAGIEVSMGSACAAGAVEPSHVLTAMGRSAAAARSSLRISLGWSTTAAAIAVASDTIPRVWRRVVATEPVTAGEVLR